MRAGCRRCPFAAVSSGQATVWCVHPAAVTVSDALAAAFRVRVPAQLPRRPRRRGGVRPRPASRGHDLARSPPPTRCRRSWATSASWFTTAGRRAPRSPTNAASALTFLVGGLVAFELSDSLDVALLLPSPPATSSTSPPPTSCRRSPRRSRARHPRSTSSCCARSSSRRSRSPSDSPRRSSPPFSPEWSACGKAAAPDRWQARRARRARLRGFRPGCCRR